MKTIYESLAFICVIAALLAWNHANAALYCYPHGMNTVCFTDDGRSTNTQEQNVRNPNTIIVPQYYPYMPNWMYHNQQPRREVPEQDFGECTLALGCIKGTR